MILREMVREFCAAPREMPADTSSAPVSYDELLPSLAGKKLEICDVGKVYEPIYLPAAEEQDASLSFLSEGKTVSFSGVAEGKIAEVLLSAKEIVNYRTGLMLRKTDGAPEYVGRIWQVVHAKGGDYLPGEMDGMFLDAVGNVGGKRPYWVSSYHGSEHRFIFFCELDNPSEINIEEFEKKLSEMLQEEATVYLLLPGTFEAHKQWRLSLGIPENLYKRPRVLSNMGDRAFFRSRTDVRF